MCSCSALATPPGLEVARTGLALQARANAWGEFCHAAAPMEAGAQERGRLVRSTAALAQKLLSLVSAEERGVQLQLPQQDHHSLACTKGHSYSCDSSDMTPSTSCGSLCARTRASTEDSSWEEEYVAPDFAMPEQGNEDPCRFHMSPHSGVADKDDECRVEAESTTHGYESLCSLVASQGSTASRGRAEEPSPSCFSSCLPWLFGEERPRRSTSSSRRRLSSRQVEYDLQHLTRVGLLGCGSFGSVTLEKCRITGQCLALKAVSKGLIHERGLRATLTTEKEAMRRCSSPFVVRLAATFSEGQYAYFLLEAVLGGDLHATYGRRFLFGSESHARFYTACVVRALEHLHEKRIIYRDIKMENIVLDARGYGKLCDFGLAAVLGLEHHGRAYTMCGTPEYMAPEVADTRGYTRAADWWSLGVLVYELMVGDTPFTIEDPRLARQSVAQGIEAQLPAGDASWAEVVCGLCQLEPGRRLPMRESGVEAFEKQAWFTEAHFDWQAHARCEMRAPYVPSIAGPKDVSNFSTGDQLPPPVVYFDEARTNGWDANFEDRAGPWIDEE